MLESPSGQGPFVGQGQVRRILSTQCKGDNLRVVAIRVRRSTVGQVHHTPYPLQQAELLALDETLLKAADLARPDMQPLVHYASGVDVRIFALRPIPRVKP